MCKTCENQSQHLLNEINELRNKIQLYEDKLRAFELKSSKVVNNHFNKIARIELKAIYFLFKKSHGASMTPRTESPERSIQFSYEEGSFELHVDTLRLTKEVIIALNNKKNIYTNLRSHFRDARCYHAAMVN